MPRKSRLERIKNGAPKSTRRGGARLGPDGKGVSGRKRGVPNKANSRREAEVKRSGETPLDYMLRVMRDPKADKARRDEMAKSAAPYVHPKFSPRSVDVPWDLSKLTDDELDAFERISRKIAGAFGDQDGETSPPA